MTTHLIIGASGLVGGHLMEAVKTRGLEVVGTYRTNQVHEMVPVDINQAESLAALVRSVSPSVIYLPACRANVDYAELHPDETYQTNVVGVANVIKAANQTGAKLVYFSTDYIFDGRSGPYSEGHPANPVCEYGRQKLFAEHLIATQAQDYLIVRTTGVYGWERQGKNFIYRLMSVLGSGDTLTVPVDQLGTPTYANNFVRAVVELALTTHRQVFHVAGTEVADRFEFALEAARSLNLNGDLIRPVSTAELGQTAPRPLQAGLRVDKASASLPFPLMGYHEGLRMMAREMNKD